MIKTEEIVEKKISDLLDIYPFLNSFLEENMLDLSGKQDLTLEEFFNSLDEEEAEDKALDKDRVVSSMAEYINRMIDFLGAEEEESARPSEMCECAHELPAAHGPQQLIDVAAEDDIEALLLVLPIREGGRIADHVLHARGSSPDRAGCPDGSRRWIDANDRPSQLVGEVATVTPIPASDIEEPERRLR